ncbi:MAG: integrase/recombinase XerD [Myxococcota bacterium]|jgi:integrase/recombinase XerD
MSIEQAAIDYIELRRGMGYQLKRAGRWVPEFGRLVDAEGGDDAWVTRKLAIRWATREGQTSGPAAAKRLGMVRPFARYLSALDSRTQIPGIELLPYSKIRPQPYLYSEADIASLLKAADALSPSFCARTHSTLLGLLAATGMRVGETLRLDGADVDLERGRITIRASKFGKSRINLLHETTVTALQQYAAQRDRRFTRPHSDAFFVSLVGRRRIYQNLHSLFHDQLIPTAGLAERSPRRPRIHDLRHTFAVQTLLRWYRTGDDVAARLPSLSTWLGHTCPSNTYWYLSATPELMECAVDRLERLWEGRA